LIPGGKAKATPLIRKRGMKPGPMALIFNTVQEDGNPFRRGFLKKYKGPDP
jgi:hypothetical protein